MLVQSEATEVCDWVEGLLRILDVRGRVDARINQLAPCTARVPAAGNGMLPYHAVLSGSIIVSDSCSRDQIVLGEGDMVLFPHGTPHQIRSLVNEHSMADSSITTASVACFPNSKVDLLSGRFILPAAQDSIVRRCMPHRIFITASTHLSSASPGRSDVARLVELLCAEADHGEVGKQPLVDAYSKALFTLAMRYGTRNDATPLGLLALAAVPRLVPALNALVSEPGTPWTLPMLASRCNMSRATFIRRFRTTVGRSANELLVDLRMGLAARRIMASADSLSAIAESVGYRSEAAFNRAFKGHTGFTPSAWRRATDAPWTM